jgi:hypothetical protein
MSYVPTGAKRLLKNSEKQIPRGLKSPRNDKNKGLVTARLKPRPFKTLGLKLRPYKTFPRRLKAGFLFGSKRRG